METQTTATRHTMKHLKDLGVLIGLNYNFGEIELYVELIDLYLLSQEMGTL